MTPEEAAKEQRAEGEALRDLMRHPGWQFFMRRIEAETQSSLGSIRYAKTEFEVMQRHAKYVALSELQETLKSHARLLLTVGAQ